MRRGVDDGKFDPSRLRLLEQSSKLAGVGRNSVELLVFWTALVPTKRAVLGINIDESGLDFALCRTHGHVNRDSGFSAAALLGDNRECSHQPPPPLHLSIAILPG